MVGGRVDGIDSDRVRASCGEDGDVAFAAFRLGQRVDVCAVAQWTAWWDFLLVGDALDEELGAVFVEELGTLPSQISVFVCVQEMSMSEADLP
jgi:hypothetical protein